VSKGVPLAADRDEPGHVAEMAAALKLRHVEITSVTRDDLEDGGAERFYETVVAVRQALPGSSVEVLTPDFKGRLESVARVAAAAPEVYNHNLETVARLYSEARPGADYGRSLRVLKWVADNAPGIRTKSGIMAGMGETRDEIEALMEDLLAAGCQVLTIGQYLAPSRRHWPVARYYEPEEFSELEELGSAMGFASIFAGPLVRSSYNAEAIFTESRASSLAQGTKVPRTVWRKS
jgi:lipoic acid synthetase